MRGGKGEWRGSGRGICGEFAQGSVGISRPHTSDRNGKSGKTSAAEKQEHEARSEILCRELARLRARSIPVGISCSQTYGGIRNGIKTEIARRERETARKRARDLRHICAGSVDISRPHTSDRNGKSGKTSAAEKQEHEARSEILCRELARLRARSIPVGISCSQTYGGIRNGIKTEIARRERETARKRARDLRHICAGSVDISRPHTNDRSGKSGKTSAAEKQEREARSEILCGELARLRARSIPVGISCSQTNGGVPQRNKDRNCAAGKGNGEEAGAGSAAYLRGECGY